MSLVYVQNLPQGTKKEIEGAFKPFGKVSWTPLSTKNGYLSGFFELATSQHAAHLADLASKLALPQKIVAKTNCKKTSTIESVVLLPLEVVTRRIVNAIEQFKNQVPEAVAQVKLDGTLDEEEIDPNLKEVIEAEILSFRKHAQTLQRTRRATAGLLVDEILKLDTPRDSKAKEDREEWAQFVRFANKCAEEEEKLRLQMKPANLLPAFYLKYKSVPPNTTKPSFISRRAAELVLEDEARRELDEAARLQQPIQAPPTDSTLEVAKTSETVLTSTTNTINSLLEEYFGDVDTDLRDFIIESAPQGSEALVEGLRELLLDETQEFVTKVMQIINK